MILLIVDVNGKRYPLFDYENQVIKSLLEPNFINARPSTKDDYSWYEEQRKLIEEGKTIPKNDNKITTSQRLLKERQNRLSYPQKQKHCAILKASGLGISELTLRFLLWLCLRNDDLKGSQIVIFTGPRLELAVSLVGRLKGLFKPHDIVFSDKETVLNINGVHIEAFPSHHADSARGLPNISAIFIDESSFIPDREVDNINDICIRNIPKSNPYLICISTPNKPNDFMDKLFQEDYATSIWKRLSLDWTWGINKIYDSNEINKIKSNNRSFEREFNLKFAGLEGNVLSSLGIDRCISLGDTLTGTAPLDDWNIQTKYVMSIDIGWGSSNTAIIVSRFVNGKVQIIYSKEFNRPVFQDIIDEIWKLYHKCNGREYLRNILIDASATELYTALCSEFDQNPSQKYLADKQSWVKERNAYLGDYLYICGVPFNPQAKHMLNHLQRMIEFQEDDGTAIVGVHSQYQDLITSMRSAYVENEKLNKERGVFADSFDSLLMNLSWYKWSK